MLKEDRYLTVEEVAERLRVGAWTVREWVKEGRIQAIKPGKQFLIAESTLEAFERASGNDSRTDN